MLLFFFNSTSVRLQVPWPSLHVGRVIFPGRGVKRSISWAWQAKVYFSLGNGRQDSGNRQIGTLAVGYFRGFDKCIVSWLNPTYPCNSAELGQSWLQSSLLSKMTVLPFIPLGTSAWWAVSHCFWVLLVRMPSAAQQVGSDGQRDEEGTREKRGRR